MTFLRGAGLETPYKASMTLEILGGTVLTLGLAILSLDYDLVSGLLVSTGLLLVLVGFLYGIVAIKCPRCRLKLAWYSYTKVPVAQSTHWLDRLQTCPRCGFEPSDSSRAAA